MKVAQTDSGKLVVVFTGELDIQGVRALEPDVAALLQRDESSVTIDFAGVEFADSSALALLIRLADHFGPLEMRGTRPLIREVIAATGLTDLLRHID